MNEYVCLCKCFFNNFLYDEGVVVVATEKEMEGNPCFKKVGEPSKKKAKKNDSN